MTDENQYRDRFGVDPDKEDVHAAIGSSDAGEFPGAFCKILRDLSGDPEFCTVVHNDGSGSNLILAYLAHRELGNLAAYKNVMASAIAMNTEDTLCVGAGINGEMIALSNTIDRNPKQLDGEALKAAISSFNAWGPKLEPYGISVLPAGGETADLPDQVTTGTINVTSTVRAKREHIIDCSEIAPDQIIVSLASFGQATYEDAFNSGIGSNGLTLARKVLLSPEYADKYPEIWDAKGTAGYQGNFKLDDPLPGAPGVSILEALTSPTRSYLPVMKKVMSDPSVRANITGMFHNTGGGQTKCLGFGNGIKYNKDYSEVLIPSVFGAIQTAGNVTEREMFQDFNMGWRLDVVCRDMATVNSIRAAAADFNIQAEVTGFTSPSSSPDINELVLHTNTQDILNYSKKRPALSGSSADQVKSPVVD